MNTLKITRYIPLICLAVLFLRVCPVFAEDDGNETIDPIQAAESEILAGINLARSDPWAEAERLGLDTEVLRAEVVPEETAAQWDRGLWPLVSNPVLNEVARAHCADMIERGYFSHITPDGLTPEDRVISAGYNATIVKEELGALAFNSYLDAGEAARMLTDAFLLDSLAQRETGEGPTLLNEGVAEVGIALCAGQLAFTEGPVNGYMLSVVLARPVMAPYHPIQCGHFFRDYNYNREYDPGEGMPGVTLSLKDGRFLAVTWLHGEYCFRRPFEDDWFMLVNGQIQLQRSATDCCDKDGIVYRDYRYSEFLGP
ncbi:MAG: CAP domain-containing protein [Deltaproteobacteria bacterium]|nr:CAP domain-containing protein [Deltaproteobacteria bacterium]MBW2098574.1 CAP domain-containing protein [Deltaproteobacteria bacterium]